MMAQAAGSPDMQYKKCSFCDMGLTPSYRVLPNGKIECWRCYEFYKTPDDRYLQKNVFADVNEGKFVKDNDGRWVLNKSWKSSKNKRKKKKK